MGWGDDRGIAADSRTLALSSVFSPTPRASRPALVDAPATLSSGTSVGRYTIVELLGRGGMGDVYAAHDRALDRKIALKLLRAAGRPREDQAQARLLREARAIAKVSHANVVTVHDAGTDGDHVFFAMELIDGETLNHWLAARPRARHEILTVFKAAARGLGAAHDAGLVHRDFKPQNVMVGEQGAVYVMDFGLARPLASPERGVEEGRREFADLVDDATGSEVLPIDLTRTGDLVGTPHYMAPEQFRAEPADARTDQFSFCVALHEALYGRRPFAGDTLPVLMTSVVTGHVSPPPRRAGVPRWLRRVLLRGLETERRRRFPSMAALVAALDAPGASSLRRAAESVSGIAGAARAALRVSARRGLLERDAPRADARPIC